MVNAASGTADAAERALVLSYAPPAHRAGLAALLALDERLGSIVRAARDPLVGQMRLTWWHDALSALEEDEVPAEPMLRSLAAEVVARGVAAATLARQVEGWEVLLDPAPLDQARLAEHGAARGAALFEAAASVLGAASRDRVASAGAGWALADLARHASASAERMVAQDAAREQLAAALDGRWSRAGRALGALAHGARLDLAGVAAGSPRRTWRLLRHRLTGR